MGVEFMKPILLDVPEQFETERLVLRAPKCGDGVILSESIRESFTYLNEWIFDHVPEIDEAEENARKSYANFFLRERFEFYIVNKTSGEFLGACLLLGIRWDVRRFEIGFWIKESASGHGYMTEAVNGVTNFTFKHFNANRIEIRCDTKNIASRRVAEKCGYHLEATLIKDYMKPFNDSDELVDTCIYTKVRLEDGTYGYPTV